MKTMINKTKNQKDTSKNLKKQVQRKQVLTNKKMHLRKLLNLMKIWMMNQKMI